MTKVVLLDSGPLGKIAHRRANPAITNWVRSLLAAGAKVVVPEIADYEVRRELIRSSRIQSLAHLDRLKETLIYLPISTEAMLAAAQLWADARNRGRPTAGHESLDADAILAGQANTCDFGRLPVIVASDNVQHLDQLTHAEYWHDILADG